MKFDIGCYGDGTHGHAYTRLVCAAEICQVLGYGPKVKPDEEWYRGEEIAELLHKEMSDDAEEERDACDWLQAHTNIPRDSYWDWQDGDFGLWLSEDM